MKFICPRCRQNLKEISAHEWICESDHLSFKQVDGIWRFLLPERVSHYAQFMQDYESIRHLEGRSSEDSAYYRALPFEDLTGKFSKDWKIRAASCRKVEKMISLNMRVVDIGAGNGWLSNRLAFHASEVFAVDLLTNEADGLGVWKHYDNRFVPIQAEFDKLPFEDKYISLIIFNASFHYSENYINTLKEALRILQPNGQIVIVDSPVYHDRESGEQMVAERKSMFLSKYGFQSDSLQSENYLTYRRMKQLGEHLDIKWKHIRPFYGIRWALRPWLARVRGHREPANFGLWVGTR